VCDLCSHDAGQGYPFGRRHFEMVDELEREI